MLSIRTLRPGLLVSLKTNIRGNVSYRTTTIESEHITEDGALEAKWDTAKRIEDAAEFERATKTRSKCRSLICSVCTASAHGLLCREEDRDRLDKAVEEARAIAREFNDTASLTRITVNVIPARIAGDDVEAVRAINTEVRELMEDMAAGLAKLNVKAVRDAADKARELGRMLTPEAAAKIQVAITAARSAATRINKAGETVAQEIDRQAIRACTEARTMFLDLDDDGEEMQAPAATGARGGIDFEPPTVEALAAPEPATRELELFV